MSVKDELKKKYGGGAGVSYATSAAAAAATGRTGQTSTGLSPVRQDAATKKDYSINKRSGSVRDTMKEKYGGDTSQASVERYRERMRRTMERDMQEDERSARDYDQSLADRLAELTGIRTSANELGRKIGLAGSYAAAGGQYDKAALEREREELLSKYGGEGGLNELISHLERRQMDSPAVNHRLTRVGNQYSSYYDPNYSTLSGVDSSVEDEKYRWINDKNFRDEYASLLKQGAQQVAFGSGSGHGAGAGLTANPYEEQALNLMTEDEVAVYNYHFAKGGKIQADRYLAAIQDSLNYRKGIQMYANMEGDTARELFFGVEAGLDQFKSGVAGLFDKGIAPTSAKQYASQMVREDLGDAGPKLPGWLGGGSLGQMGYDAVTTTANMAPSILTSTVVGMVNPALGGYAGLSMMSGSAAGNARQEKLREGYSDEQATAYGLMVGASEAVMEKLLGGISKLGGQGLGGLANKLTSGAFTGFLDKLDNAFVRVAAEAGEKMLSEGTEEYLQEIIDPILRNVALGENNQMELVTEEALYSGLLGAITGGVMEGPGVIRGNIARSQEAAIKAKSEKYGAQAQNFVQNYQQGQNPELYDNNYNLVYEEAKGGVSLDHVLQNEETAKYLSDEQIEQAWRAGKAAGGWATVRETGESVKVKGVADAEGGFDLELEDGKRVKRGDIILPTHSEELALRGIEDLKVNAEDANALLSSFREGDVSGDVYSQGVQAAFQAGGKDIPMRELAAGTSAAAALSEAQRAAAYELGRKYADTQVRQAQAALVGKATAPGRVHYDGDVSKLSEIQRSSVTALETVAEALGVQIHLYESQVGEDGLRDSPNGWYDTRTGDIHIDIHAGQSGRGTMMFTAAHELTHWVKQWSPKKFKALADFLMEQYGEKGVSVEELIERQQAKAKAGGHPLDYDAAFEELVADSMETMLADGAIVEKLAQLKKQDKSLWEKLKEKVAELVGKLKEAYKGLKPDSAEGKYVAEMLDAAEELKRLFAEGLEDAGRSFRGEAEATAEDSLAADKDSLTTVSEMESTTTRGDYDPSRDYEPEFSRRDNEKTARIGGVKFSERDEAAFAQREEMIELTVDEAIANKGILGERYNQKRISAVPSDVAGMVKAASGGDVDVSQKYIALDGGEVWHEYRRHSDETAERDRGQIAFTKQQFVDAIKSIYKPDFVECVFRSANNPTQRQSFAYAKRTTQGHYVVVEAVGGKKNPNIVPVEILYVSKAKWEKWVGSGRSIGEMLFASDPKKLAALDPEFNKKNRVTAAQFASDEAIASTPHSPRSGIIVAQDADGVNTKLSARDADSNDIRFSERDPAVEKLNRALEKKNAALEAEVEYLKEFVGLQSKITKGTKFTRSSVEQLAGQLMKEARARGDRKELAGILNGVYEYIAGLDDPAVSPDWEDIAERTGEAAKWLMDHVEVKQERGEYADEILKELRTMRISLNKGQVAEVASRYGSYNEFRRAMFGSLSLSRNGTPLDVVWQDLAAQYPGTFDANIKDADMPLKLADIVAGLRDADLARAEFEANREGMIEDLRQKVYEGYWKVSTLRTVADKWQKKLNEVKSRHGYTMEQLKQAKAEVREADAQHRQTIRELRQEKHEAVRSTEAKVAEYYQNARKKATEGRHKTAMRHRIERTVRELEGLLLRGSKERNVKEGMRSFAEEALASANVLFMDSFTDEELVLEGIGTDLTPEENRMIDEVQHLLSQKKDLLSDVAIADESEAVAVGDTRGYDERMEQLDSLEKQINYRMVRLQDVLTRERARLNKATVGAVLKNLSTAYKALGQSDDLYIRGAARQEVWEHLDGLIGTIGGTRVRDMTLAQLEDVYKAFRMVLTTVRDANKLFTEGQKQTLSEAARMAAMEVTANGKNSRLGVKLVEELKKFGFNNLKPVYFFEHLNSNTLRQLYKGLMKGQDAWARDVTEAREYFRQAADRHGMKKWDQEKTFTFRSASGQELKLNVQQMMSLYAYSRRPQARDHIRKGGVVIAAETEIEEVVQIGKRFKVKLKGTNNDATAYNIDDYVLGEIISKLTKEQKQFVEEMQSYLSDVMGGKGNEVSMTLYGVKLFNEKAYFPLRSAHQYMARAKEQAEQTAKVKNAGFTKAVQVKANNPVVLSPFMDVWSDHVDEMSLYHGMTLPLEDLHRVYTFAHTGDGAAASQSVTAAIENAFGSQATEYIDQLMKDLNGGARVDTTTGIINKSMALFKKGSTFLSASVVIQQSSAIVRATAMVDSKYFQWAKLPGKWALDLGFRRKQHDRLWAEVKQYAPVALIKEMGYFDTSVGRSTRDFIQAQEYTTFDEKMKGLIHDSGYRDEVLSRAPALADELAWCSIWEAVKREQHDKHKNLQVGSEEFLKLCGERFTEVIDRTQVYDSVLARSANMRSKDTGMKMATAFMAEPTVSANMAADALLKGKRGDKKFCRRAIGSVISSGILNAMLYSIVAAARDDDEDKEYWEKYLGSVTGEVFEVINPATYLPFARDVWSLVQGYDVERSDMALVADLVNAIRAFGSDSKTGWEKVEQFGSTVFKLFGLPLGNVLRDAKALFRTVGDAVDGQGSTAAGIGYAVMASLPFGKAASDGQQLYEATVKGDKEQIERVTARYKDASGAQSALRKALRENDSRIREAAVAWNEGRLEDYMSIARAIIGEKHFTQDDVVAAIRAEANALLPDKEETETAVNHKGLFTAAAFAVAAADGDADMMAAIREDLIQTAVSNGKTEEAARKSAESSMKSEVKECVLGGLLTEAQARTALTGYCGMEAADAEETIRQWKFEWSERMDCFTEAAVAGNGEADGIRKDVIAASVAGGQNLEEAEKNFQSSFRSTLGDLYDAEGVSDKQAVSLLQKYGGKDADGALTTVRYWEFRRDNPGVNVDDSWIDKYYSEIRTSGMSIETYVRYRDEVKDITGTGKKEGRMAVIDSLPISNEQKDALYYSEGWAKSRIYEAPWH